MATDTSTSITPPANPWRFLTALDGGSELDRQLIRKTRPDEIELISNMVAASRVSIVYSYSGNGKSSILNAGLIPFLRENSYAVFRMRPRPPWSVEGPTQAFKDSILRDVNLPLLRRSDVDLLRRAKLRITETSEVERNQLDNLIQRLETQIRTEPTRNDTAGDVLKAELKHHASKPLAEFIAQVQTGLDTTTTLAFICDQFEELFVHYGNTPAMQEFVSQIGEVWADDSLRVRLIFSMREDWVGSMIEFRKAIPDIFRDSFKLTPLARSRAGHVLTMPLEWVGHSFEPAAVDAILNDLADSYRRTQEDRFSDVHLTLSPRDDPFIELPALQVIADRLWVTKDSVSRPFTLEHYRSLAAGRRNHSSPAMVVLDDYLDNLIGNAEGAGDLTPDQWRALRLDCLYLLTDRVGHRRALTEKLLLEELRQIRSQALDPPEVSEARLNAALAPLQRARLIREDVSRSGERQYELAHDFAVRSVVAKWRQLDRARAATLAVLEEAKKRSQIKVAGLEGFDRRVTQLLLIAPIVCIIAFVAVGQTFDGTESWQALPHLPLRFLLMTVPFLLVLLVGILRGHHVAAALGAVGSMWSASLPALGDSSAFEGHVSQSILLMTVVPLYLITGVTFGRQELVPAHVSRLFARLWSEYLAVGAAAASVVAAYVTESLASLVPVVVYVVWSAALLSRREYAFAEGWTGLRIRNLDGQPLPLGRAVLRQALQVSWLCLLWVLSLMAMIAIAPSGPYGFDGVWMLFWAAAWAACAAGITATNAKHRHLYDIASGAYPFTSEAQVLPDMAGRAAGGRVKGAIGVLISAVAWALGASVSFASLGLTTSSEHGGAAWLCGVIGGAGAAIGLEMTSASPSARTRSWLAGGWTVAMTLCGMVLRANSYYTGYYSYSIAGYRINSDAVLAAGLVGGLVGGVATAIALRPGGSYRRFAAAAIWAMAIGLVPSMCAALTQDFAPFVGTVIGPAVAGAIGQGATLWVFKGTRTEITPKVNA